MSPTTLPLASRPPFPPKRFPTSSASTAGPSSSSNGAQTRDDRRSSAVFARDVVLPGWSASTSSSSAAAARRSKNLLARVGKKGRIHPGHASPTPKPWIVEMVLGGQVNKEIVNLINQHGGKAVGLTGKDGLHPRQADAGAGTFRGDLIDVGQVGDITGIDLSLTFLDTGDFILVIAPIGVGRAAKRTTSTPTSSPASSPRSSRPRSWCC